MLIAGESASVHVPRLLYIARSSKSQYLAAACQTAGSGGSIQLQSSSYPSAPSTQDVKR